MDKSKINKRNTPTEKNTTAPLKQSKDITPLNNPIANTAKQKNIQEADQQPQVTTSTPNHIKNKNEFADSETDNDKAGHKDKPGCEKDEDSVSKQKENKNIAKGYL